MVTYNELVINNFNYQIQVGLHQDCQVIMIEM